MMRMAFFWTTDLGDFFFKDLKVNGVWPLALACLVVGILAILYEGIKVHSATVRARAAREQIAAVSCAPSETANLLVTDQNALQKSFSKRFCKLFSEAIVFLFHNSIGYIVMLSCMVYSGWMFLAVVLSMGLGYFLFGHISMKINMENVQARSNTVICSTVCPENGDSTAEASKNTTPCRSISEQVNQQHQQQHPQQQHSAGPSAPQAPDVTNVRCHEIQETKTVAAVPVVADSDCCCRL